MFIFMVIAANLFPQMGQGAGHSETLHIKDQSHIVMCCCLYRVKNLVLWGLLWFVCLFVCLCLCVCVCVCTCTCAVFSHQLIFL
jgi:hypothetical protein